MQPTARPGQPSLHHLAVCPLRVFEGRKQSGRWCINTYRHAHIWHTWSQRVTVALVYPALPPLCTPLSSSALSLSCCVSLPTNVSATVGQWLILVCLAKCLEDVCLGCLIPPRLPTPTRCTSKSGGLRVAHCHSETDRSASSSSRDKGYLNWQRSSFMTRATFCQGPPRRPPPRAVCLVSAAGVWWEKSWPSTGGAVTLHCQCAWLAYHSPRWEEIHHRCRQGFPSLEPIPCFLLHCI